MSSAAVFEIRWEAGASAQLEVFSPGADTGADAYRLKYTPPFRKTIRPPLSELRLGPEELNPIRERLNTLMGVVAARGATASGTPPSKAVVLEEAKLVGSQLLDLIVPPDVQAELRVPGLSLEIGVDEALVEYPWELMHDGDEFLCLRHQVGRFVNTLKPAIPSRQRPADLEPGALSVLLITVPKPQPRQTASYEPLIEAEAETEAILETLLPLGDAVKVTLLKGPKANADEVYKAIKAARYHIVHFNGHAYFRNDKPHLSSLVLYDRDFTTGPITNFFGNRPPVFFCMNACETAAAQGSGAEWRNRYDIFGLARAFLETGAYLLGNRWKVGDKVAARFASAFYSALIEGCSLGRAVRDARLACRQAITGDDFSWTSYTLYGDPRLRFHKI